MLPRYLINSTSSSRYPGLGKAAQVHTLVGLAPSNRGTTAGGLRFAADHLPLGLLLSVLRGASSILG